MARPSDNGFKEYVKKDTAYMPMPDHCGRGVLPVFNGVTCVNLLICYYYCTEPEDCKEYQEYLKCLKRNGNSNNKKQKEIGRKQLDL